MALKNGQTYSINFVDKVISLVSDLHLKFSISSVVNTFFFSFNPMYLYDISEATTNLRF